MNLLKSIARKRHGEDVADMLAILDQKITDVNEGKIVKSGLNRLVFTSQVEGFGIGMFFGGLLILIMVLL